jgi:hypothetical protein
LGEVYGRFDEEGPEKDQHSHCCYKGCDDRKEFDARPTLAFGIQKYKAGIVHFVS